MAVLTGCDVCGNEYANAMRIQIGDREGVFDSFECAIHALAPTCEHCGIKIAGHGVQAGDRMFCCAHCARANGVQGLADAI
jgi:hypothetical protein